MQKVLKTVLFAAVMLTLGAGSVVAGTQDRTNSHDRDRDKSCQQSYMNTSPDSVLLAADQIQQRDKKHDGSCKS